MIFFKGPWSSKLVVYAWEHTLKEINLTVEKINAQRNVHQAHFDWIEGSLHEMDPISDSTKVTENLRIGKLQVLSKIYYYSSTDT